MITRYLLPGCVGLALVCAPAFGAGESGQFTSSRQQQTANEKSEADDLVLPELDRPASKKKTAASEDRQAPSGRPRQASAASEKLNSAARERTEVANEDDSDVPQASLPKSVARPQGKGAYASYGQPLNSNGDYPSRSALDDGSTQLRSRSQSRNLSGSSSAYRPATAQLSGGSTIQRPSQSAAPGVTSLGYPEYGPRHVASRYQPTAADMSNETRTPLVPEPVAPGNSTQRFESSEPLAEECGDACCAEMAYCKRGGFFGGAEFLLVRPTFSENQAYLQFKTTTDVDENQTIVNTVVPQNFDYNGSLRAFVGYRLCDCCGEIRFTYWNFGDSSRQQTIPVPEGASTTFGGQLELNALNPGDRLLVNSSLLVNTYDIDYSKCITYGGCDCCDPCNYCPPWGLKYYVGIRIADVRRGDNTQLSNVTSDQPFSQQASIQTKFVGAGPRVGIEGRRFFGCDGCFSLFVRSNFALLLGQNDINETRFTPGNDSPNLTERYVDSHDRIIPVAEIELGGNWDVTCNTTLSLGYMFQAWWDLGAFEQVQGNIFQNPIDDANIMSFDGLFARLEYRF
jgi:Legionella pneumophila major outer membrane protein precursor